MPLLPTPLPPDPPLVAIILSAVLTALMLLACGLLVVIIARKKVMVYITMDSYQYLHLCMRNTPDIFFFFNMFHVFLLLYLSMCTVQMPRPPWPLRVQYRRPACLWDASVLADTYEVDPSDIICNEEMDSIGDGSFGNVWLGSFRGQAVAIKTMKSTYEPLQPSTSQQ